MAKMKAIVQFEYIAAAPDELTLRAGDVLTDVKVVEPGWCNGLLNGKTGLFPDNFVKMEEDKTVDTPKSKPAAKPEDESKQLYKVTFAYESQNKDELSMAIGEIVVLLKEIEEGWAKGRLNGKEGLFPTNFVVPYTKSPTINQGAEESQKSKGTPDQTPAKKVASVESQNKIADNLFKLETASDDVQSDTSGKNEPSEHKAEKETVPEKPEAISSTAQKAQPPVEKCLALFDYPAETEDELSLKKGDVVTVTNKNCVDPGWWEGEVTGGDGRKRRGIFPDNFVKLIQANKDEKNKTSNEKPVDKKRKDENGVTEQSGSQVKLSSASHTSSEQNESALKVQMDSSNDKAANELTEAIASSSEEQQLIHHKRPGGPKNRRKPADAKRRERANEAAEAADAVEEVSDSEPQQTEAKTPPVQVPPKREPIRGIQVMPALSGGNTSGETPGWMQNLKKNRASLKKPAGSPLSAAKPEPANEKPSWMANLRKPKSGENADSSQFAPKPSPGVTPPKPTHPHQTASQAPVRPSSPDKGSIEKNNEVPKPRVQALKPQSEREVLSPPPKPSVDAPKKPQATAKPKLPPPPKIRPVIPAAKPSTSIDELKEELKALKEQFALFQLESTKELSRLSKELSDEKTHRQNLQAEIAKLSKHDG